MNNSSKWLRNIREAEWGTTNRSDIPLTSGAPAAGLI